MTEYDFSPDAYQRYMDTQNRIADWAGSSQQYSGFEPHGVPPSRDGRFMGDGYPHHGRPDDFGRHESERRGRSTHRRRSSSGHRGRSPHAFANTQFTPGHQVHERTASHGSFRPNMNGSIHPMNSRQNSMGYASPHGPSPSVQPDQPLEEHYPILQPNSTPQLSMVHVPSQNSLPYAPSHRSGPHSMHQYPSSPAHHHMSRSGYGSRYSSRRASPDRYSDYSYSSRSRSYSPDSYSRSRSRGSRMYQSHRGMIAPNIVQPTHSRPVIVPINGGFGGFVVVPAVGQTLHVMVRIWVRFFELWTMLTTCRIPSNFSMVKEMVPSWVKSYPHRSGV